MVSSSFSSQSSRRLSIETQRFFPQSNPPVKLAVTQNPYATKMGCRSQVRNGSVKACKKRATQAKHKRTKLAQRGIDGQAAFVSILHCKVCKAFDQIRKGNNVNAPHRSHDRRCYKNRSTRAMSEFTVFVEKTVAENNRINTTKLGQNLALDAKTRKLFGSVSRYFKPPGMEATTNPKKAPTPDELMVCQPVTSPESFSPKNYADPTHIRRVLDQRMAEFLEDTNFGWAKDSKVSKSLLLTVDYIYGLLSTNKHSDTARSLPSSQTFKKSSKSWQFFRPGSCEFKFEFDYSCSTGAPALTITP
jgi:hypothetical protein